MRIAIYGLGVVGGALARYLEAREHEIMGVDPFKGREDEVINPSAVFICVPAPTKGFQVDTSIIDNIIIRHAKTTYPIFIRSTVPPGTADSMAKKHRCNVVSFPEFLTERQADQDMRFLPLVYGRGGERILTRLFDGHHHIILKNAECEMAKYAHNCFGALKVTFFNGIYEHATRLGLNYESVLRGVLASGHINSQHTMVPGPDGQKGYGGHCFPKDMEGFIGFLKSDILGKWLMDAHCMNRFYRELKSSDKRPKAEVNLNVRGS